LTVVANICVMCEQRIAFQWTVPQLAIMINYNSTWQILIQWIRDILSGDILT